MQINIVFQQLSLLQTGTVAEVTDKTVTEIINGLSVHIFPNFRSVVEIFDKSTCQGIPVLEHSVGLNTRGGMKQVLNFAKRYVSFRDNLSSRFDYFILKLCKKFRISPCISIPVTF